jgi:hypothetical protein
VDKLSKTSDRRKHQEKCSRDADSPDADEDIDDSEITGIMLDDSAQEYEAKEDAEEHVLQIESHKRPELHCREAMIKLRPIFFESVL